MKLLILSLLISFSAQAEVIHNMTLFGKMNKYVNDKYSAIWGYTAPDGTEYALLAARSGTSIVDLSTPALKEVAFIPGAFSTWRELKTFKNYAYVVTDNASSGVQIIDLSKLPNEATLVNTFKDYPMSHTLWTDEATSTLFLMGGTADTVVALSLNDPVNPEFISQFGSSYVHDAYFRDGKAYLSEIMSKSFSVFDITDLANPKFVKRVRDPAAPSVSFHNSWLTEDSRYLVTTEETIGRSVKIWDLQDVNNIKLVSEYNPPNKLAHNVQIKGQYAYFSAYGAGLRVVDLKDPKNPTEVAYWARKDGLEKGFVSVWGCFPFFKSGKVIGSDIEEGLVVTVFEPGKEE